MQDAFYEYPLVIFTCKPSSKPMHQRIKKFLRLLRITQYWHCLLFLIAKPQLVDNRSNVIIDGIDIMLVLDVSGSMQFQDYDDDQRSRMEVAKDEALRFVNKRTNDAIGLVIFGKDALSRVPLNS